MKRLGLMILIIISVSSCKKSTKQSFAENDKTVSVVQFEGTYQKELNTNYEGVSVENNMLHFIDNAAYQTVYKQLLENKRMYQSMFMDKALSMPYSQVSNLSEEQISAVSEDISIMAQQLGYSDDDILLNFESQYSYTSKRSQLQAEENSFLTAADDNTDLGQTPMNKFGGESTFQTLLNSDGELSIGDKIFKQYENGLTIIIEDGDIQTLNSIRADINEIYNKSNVTILNPDDELAKSVRACRYNVYESKTKSYGSNRKTTGYLSYWYIFDSGWGWRYYGKVTNYVKKSGIWKKDYNNCNLNAPDVNLKKYSDCSSTSYNKNLQYPWSWTGHTTDYAIQIDDYEWSPINWTAIHNGEAKMIFNASGMPVQNVIISW